jgi:hypothetical protein
MRLKYYIRLEDREKHRSLERHRRVATRYDKLAATLFGMVCFAALFIGFLRAARTTTWSLTSS